MAARAAPATIMHSPTLACRSMKPHDLRPRRPRVRPAARRHPHARLTARSGPRDGRWSPPDRNALQPFGAGPHNEHAHTTAVEPGGHQSHIGVETACHQHLGAVERETRRPPNGPRWSARPEWSPSSARAAQASTEPSAMPGSQASRCDSVPKAAIGMAPITTVVSKGTGDARRPTSSRRHRGGQKAEAEPSVGLGDRRTPPLRWRPARPTPCGPRDRPRRPAP